MIIFDTSVLFGLTPSSPNFDLLRALKRSGIQSIAIPWMVREELAAQQVLAYIEAHERAVVGINGLNHRTPWEQAHRVPALHADRAAKYWSEQYEEIFDIIETSGEAARQALLREANRTKPAKVKEKLKGGARDAAIWLSVIEYMKSNPSESVFFVSSNTDDFGSGQPYPSPMADDLRGMEGRLTHLTSFEGFVSRFTEKIDINIERVRSILTNLLREKPTLVESAATAAIQGSFSGTSIDSAVGEPIRCAGWLGMPTASLSKITEVSGHKIGDEEWYTATVTWILAGYSLPSSFSAENSPILVAVACEWRTKLLFGTREGETPSILRHETPKSLDPGQRDEWQSVAEVGLSSSRESLNQSFASLWAGIANARQDRIASLYQNVRDYLAPDVASLQVPVVLDPASHEHPAEDEPTE